VFALCQNGGILIFFWLRNEIKLGTAAPNNSAIPLLIVSNRRSLNAGCSGLGRLWLVSKHKPPGQGCGGQILRLSPCLTGGPVLLAERHCCKAHRSRQGAKCALILYYYIITRFVLPRSKVRLLTSCGKGCQVPTHCWPRQIQARPNQPWARCSVFIPPPAGRGRAHLV
jgi:hypothetical protein